MAAMTIAARASPIAQDVTASAASSTFSGLRARPHSSAAMVGLRSRATRLRP
jgi:hypothetical protein